MLWSLTQRRSYIPTSTPKIRFDWRYTKLSLGQLNQHIILDDSKRADMFQQMVNCGMNRNLSIFVAPRDKEFIVLQKTKRCLKFRLLNDGNWLITNNKKYSLPYMVSHLDILLMRDRLIRDVVHDNDSSDPKAERQSDFIACLITIIWWLAYIVLLFLASILCSGAVGTFMFIITP